MIRGGSILALFCLIVGIAPRAACSYSTDVNQFRAHLNPLGALQAYNQAMLTGQVQQLLARSYAVTQQGQQLQQATCQNDAAAGKVLAAAAKIWNAATVDQIGHMIGDQNNDDIGDAPFTIDGNHATVNPVCGGAVTMMIRDIDGQWKLDMESRLPDPEAPEATEQAVRQMTQSTELAKNLAVAIAAKKFQTVDEVQTFVNNERDKQAEEDGDMDEDGNIILQLQ